MIVTTNLFGGVALLLAAVTMSTEGSVCKTLDSPAMMCAKNTANIVDVRFLPLNATGIDDADAQSVCSAYVSTNMIHTHDSHVMLLRLLPLPRILHLHA